MKRIFPPGTTAEQIALAVVRMIPGVPQGKPIAVTVEEWKKPRTNQQNAFLWGVVYPSILEGGGEQLRGYNRDDIHEFMLGEWGGWETLEGLGRKRLRPLRRSSRLTKEEFTEYLDFITMKCSQLGIHIDEPAYVPGNTYSK
jgi:hypothetical protein